MPNEKYQLTSLERLNLIQALENLSLDQFDALIFAIDPPPGKILERPAPHKQRCSSLLKWVECPEGPGLEELQEVLEALRGHNSNYQKSEYTAQPEAEKALEEIIHTLSKNQSQSKEAPKENGVFKIISEHITEIIIALLLASSTPWWVAKIPSAWPLQNRKMQPTAFIDEYYETINDNEIEEAWEMLTPGFQKESSGTFSDYKLWWDKVDSVQVSEVTLLDEDGETATVKAELGYIMGNKYTPEQPIELKLVWNKDKKEWQIDERIR